MDSDSDDETLFDSLNHMRIHPNFLISNATSHTWALGAIAELIDNAQDPDCSATTLHIDVDLSIPSEPHLFLIDNGKGCSVETLTSMLSMGYCDKNALDLNTIGRYGNGFKSGTMRIGKDVLVLSKTLTQFNIGFLSQTFLFDKQAQQVYVPIVSFPVMKSANGEQFCEFNVNELSDASKKGLKIIFNYSYYTSIEEIIGLFERIHEKSGTLILIYNLKRDEENNELELDFNEDVHDIRIAKKLNNDGIRVRYAQERAGSSTSSPLPMDFSLRSYCEILYTSPRIKIYIRNSPVRTKRIRSSLKNAWADHYIPRQNVDVRHTGGVHGVSEMKSEIVFGMNSGWSKDKNEYGMMLYHHGRLIRSYVKVGVQRHPNSAGMGVLGVVDCDYLTPTHNKQDFNHNNLFNSLMESLNKKLNEYWNERSILLKSGTGNHALSWVQCDNCNKWRILPMNVKVPGDDEFWECSKNRGYVNYTSVCGAPDDKDVKIVRKSVLKEKKNLKRLWNGSGGHGDGDKLKFGLGKNNKKKEARMDSVVSEIGVKEVEEEEDEENRWNYAHNAAQVATQTAVHAQWMPTKPGIAPAGAMNGYHSGSHVVLEQEEEEEEVEDEDDCRRSDGVVEENGVQEENVEDDEYVMGSSDMERKLVSLNVRLINAFLVEGMESVPETIDGEDLLNFEVESFAKVYRETTEKRIDEKWNEVVSVMKQECASTKNELNETLERNTVLVKLTVLLSHILEKKSNSTLDQLAKEFPELRKYLNGD